MNGLFGNARFGMGFDLHVLGQAGESQIKVMNICWNILDQFIDFHFRLDLDATPVMVRLIRPASPGRPADHANRRYGAKLARM